MLTNRSRFIPVLATVFALLAASVGAAVVDGRARVIDGDTVSIGGESVRLHGIDAPEIGQRCVVASGRQADCGAIARDALRDRIGDRRVLCEGGERDRYGRLVARCFVGDEDLGRFMVAQGHAVAYRRFSSEYVGDEAVAQAALRGFWAGGPLLAPEAFRAQARAASQETPDLVRALQGGCVIAGNISGNGHIYHMPGQRDYDAVRIDLSRGERWFCTEAEARAAGWRAARR